MERYGRAGAETHPSSPLHPQGCHISDPPPAAVCRLLTVDHIRLLCWETLNCVWSSSACRRLPQTCLLHRSDACQSWGHTAARSPSRAIALLGFPLFFLCILRQRLCLSHLSAGFVRKQHARNSACALLSSREPLEKIMPVALLFVDHSTGRAALPSLQETFLLKGKTQQLFLNPTEQDKSTCGEKNKETECRFCRQFSQTLGISRASLSCLQCCHNRSVLPFPNLSWKRLSLCCLEMVSTAYKQPWSSRASALPACVIGLIS